MKTPVYHPLDQISIANYRPLKDAKITLIIQSKKTQPALAQTSQKGKKISLVPSSQIINKNDDSTITHFSSNNSNHNNDIYNSKATESPLNRSIHKSFFKRPCIV